MRNWRRVWVDCLHLGDGHEHGHSDDAVVPRFVCVRGLRVSRHLRWARRAGVGQGDRPDAVSLWAVCDTIVVVNDDGVLFAKNSDRDPNEAQLIEWHPRATHAAGAAVRCTWIEVPQAAETHAILISRPFWIWGAEMGSNQHGVTIGNEAVFTNEPYAPTGLTGMDLVRLALERGASATQAVEVLVDLLERHGQGGGCGHENRSFSYHNSFLVADPAGAFVVETAGAHWAVEPVLAGVRTISNGLTIRGFAERHSDRLKTAVSRCRVRQRLTSLGASGEAGTLMSLLRSHGNSEWPRYSPVNGAMAAPCMHAGGLLTASQTTASWVSELRRDGARHWATATAAPCTSLFKPVRVDDPLDVGPAPTDRFDERALWWRHERLHRMALRDPSRARFRAQRDDVQQHWLADPPASSAAFAQADDLLERWAYELGALDDLRPWWVRRYWRDRDRSAGISYRTDTFPGNSSVASGRRMPPPTTNRA
jgi:secernin